MTAAGFYDVAVVLAFVGLVAVAGASLIARWQRRRALPRLWMSPEFQRVASAMRRTEAAVGVGLVGPLSRMANALNDANSPALSGTVQNPAADPSPLPKGQFREAMTCSMTPDERGRRTVACRTSAEARVLRRGRNDMTDRLAETKGMTDDPNVTITDRGFKHLDAVPGSYGGEVRIYESSGVTPAIWLNAKSVKELDDEGKYLAAPVPQEAIVLLTLANARVLRDQLSWLIDHHFLAGEPEDEDDDG